MIRKQSEVVMPLDTRMWLSSTALTLCSPSTRAIWLDLLCRFHGSRANGISCTIDQLTRLGRCNRDEALRAIEEIQNYRLTTIESDGETYFIRLREKIDRTATPEWRKVRLLILRRDNRTCRYCGDRAGSVDHIQPYSRGGSDDPTNLVACCRTCNSRKKDRTPQEAGMVLRG